ncbi:UspA family nucleotide-binding protein [Weissella oryzae SG25]|uniref:UspA family nucleotide-binding protein n=1 Tax=Weissella oryzae (strain DSM 25784 / JCM 18191 / LMG 30913 / SG25) TaxID=1329250 RepID=A0A069CUI7_WEIOS|nr:universal stress protein [Weissella oryzae]GAK30878.1 UspA family nucleotide-binding protein [Weissella oryzae SG25]
MNDLLKFVFEPRQFKSILVGVDESEQGHVALANAIHQAQEDGAELTIATILEIGDLSTIDALNLPVIRDKQAELESNLARYRKYALSKGLTDVTVKLGTGGSAGEVLLQEIVPAVKADLIIVGAHSHEGFWGKLGSQAVYIARNATISSMIARQASED